jgi:hypothetical protein
MFIRITEINAIWTLKRDFRIRYDPKLNNIKNITIRDKKNDSFIGIFKKIWGIASNICHKFVYAYLPAISNDGVWPLITANSA